MIRNEIVLDGKVQKDAKVLAEVSTFNISAITGEYKLTDNSKRNRYTYIRVIYVGDKTPELEKLLQTGNMVRIYGKLDSEQYVAKSNKVVYNKILNATKITQLVFDKETKEYREV